MTYKNVIVKTLVFVAGLSGFFAYALTKQIFNTPTAVSAPSTDRLILYSLNANQGELIKKNSSTYELILYNVHEVVNYSNSRKVHSSELISTKYFIKKWQKFKDINIEADIAGIQVNNKIFGHTEFYATAFLKQPRYILYSSKIIFVLIPIKPRINLPNKKAIIENVTIYLNGCNFCDCENKDNNSLKNCM